MEWITSPDETVIACHRRGTGPPLVMVHGIGGANATAWPATTRLEQHFTVYAVDRRGRGESSDGRNYAIEREFADVAAVVDAIGEPVYLLGHSFGGLCALEASLLTKNIDKLVLYEPSVPLTGVPLYTDGMTERFQALLDAGDREGVLTAFYGQIGGLSSQEIERLKSSPAWPARLATAHTIPREMQAEERYGFDRQRFQELRISTLLLAGGDSPHDLRQGVETVHAALPNSRIVFMPGQQHIAMYTAPDLFVNELVRFLLSL